MNAKQEAKNAIRQAICDAVWERHIDQMTTREVATEFGCSRAMALSVLMSIYVGTSGDSRFVENTERGYGVFLQDGSTFAYGSTDANNLNQRHENRPAHYIWFAD